MKVKVTKINETKFFSKRCNMDKFENFMLSKSAAAELENMKGHVLWISFR